MASEDKKWFSWSEIASQTVVPAAFQGVLNTVGDAYKSQDVYDGFQTGATCAPHAIANVIETSLNTDVDPNTIINQASQQGLLTSSGMQVSGIVEVFEENLVPVNVQTSQDIQETLESLLESGRPVLMAVDASDQDGTSGVLWNENWTPNDAIGFEGIDPPDHAIVVHGIEYVDGNPQAVIADSADHAVYQKIPLEQLIDAADGGGGIMVSPVVPPDGFSNHFNDGWETETTALEASSMSPDDFYNLKAEYVMSEESNDTFVSGEIDVEIPSTNEPSEVLANTNDNFRDEFSEFLNDAPDSANQLTVSIVDAMNDQMVSDGVPMSESHYEAATEAIEQGYTPMEFLFAENPHVLESTGSGIVYESGKLFHEGLHAIDSIQDSIGAFTEQVGSFFSPTEDATEPVEVNIEQEDPPVESMSNEPNEPEYSIPQSFDSPQDYSSGIESYDSGYSSDYGSDYGGSNFESGASSYDGGGSDFSSDSGADGGE